MSGKEGNFENAWTHSKKHAGKSNKSEVKTCFEIGNYNRLSVQTRSDFGVYLGVVGDFVFLIAKDVAPFGTFMDWGLEKDLLVPKSSPEEIRKNFSMSKKEFKRAVGNLYKKRLIELKDNGIGLIR